MNYADIRAFDSTNGLGVATTLFVSGCNFHCKGCFNEKAQDFNFGNKFTKEVEDEFIQYAKNKYVDHVSLLGGEIFHQDLDIILNLVRRIKNEVNKPIWIWSGFTLKELLQDNKKVEILKYVDVLTDGRFDINNKEIGLFFKGSSNQVNYIIKEDEYGNINGCKFTKQEYENHIRKYYKN